MSRIKHQAAFAIACDGTMLVNVAHVGRRLSPSRLLEWALQQRGAVFVGLQVSAAEASYVLDWCRYQHEEAVAYVIGGREQRMRRKRARSRDAQR